MKPEQEDFEALCRLLKLKRYEQPPPRYFNDFSSQVVARIRAGDAGGRGTVLASGSWLVRLWSLIEAKPMLPGSIGVAICALLVFGAIYSDNPPNAPGSIFADTDPRQFAPEPAFAVDQNQGEVHATVFTSTNPVIQVGDSLFDQVRLPMVQPTAGPNPLIPFGHN
jgi:hypothetical protein